MMGDIVTWVDYKLLTPPLLPSLLVEIRLASMVLTELVQVALYHMCLVVVAKLAWILASDFGWEHLNR
ncbi:hypothetical protein Poli38472_006914 [Pythium oligandrum]|uniref:Uncharacterized protein n=1 Tax=Pythium oligandrum TaxID=41045 RepID=A0A8K1FF96_PYTOL|nr:hypothetical protein Poli38472_006914 [Pythium oligandrum]|eukprot:TMW58769.1 hypothetical protein Poli38472_006914 [Pythium oligandrum]